MVGPQRRSSSVASSCVSSEFGDLQDGQSPGKTNGLGKSPVASMTLSPQTPVGLEKSGSPSAMKKRRASIGGADDLARGLDFGTTSPSTEEKKHPFLTRGGGHKKVASPATQTSSPGKKATTPPGKEKLVAVRSPAVSTLSPRKSVEAKKDIMSPRRSVLGSEGASTNGSLISEGTSSLVEVTSKKTSPRASLEGKVSAGKPSPRSNMKPVASTKGRKSSNGGSAATDSPTPEAETKFSPVKTPDVKISSVKTPDVKTKKSSPQSPVPSLKFRPGLTSPKSQKSAKTRQNTPSQPGRAKTRIEKSVRTENLPKPELDSVAVQVSPENETQTQSENVVVEKMEEDGSTLLPSLMVDDNVGDEDMNSLDHGGDPGFDNDMEMPTSWLSEDLTCMFSSLSRLPEPDDSSSSHFGDPPEFLDEPFAEDTKQKSSELANPKDVIVAAEVMPRSPVASPDGKFVAAGFPSEISKEVDESEWNYESRTYSLLEDSNEAEFGHDQPCESNELESRQPSPFPAVVEPVALSQDEGMPCMVSTYLEEKPSFNNGSPVTDSVAPEASLSSTVNMLTGEPNLQFLSESRSVQPVSSQSDEEPAEVVTQVAVPTTLKSNGGVYHFDSSREMDSPYATSALSEEERWTAAEDEVSATQDHLVIASSDDESSEDFIEGTCGAQLNLKQSFDAAAEPASSQNELEGACDVLPRDSRLDTSDMDLEPMPTVAYGKVLPEVTKVTESEFADKSQDEQESGTFAQTHVDKDMMIFDFEEYWTQNAGDESFHSDAGQNDAEDLQLYSMRETQLLSPVFEDKAEKSVPLNELPVSNLPGDQSIHLEPESSDQLGVTQLDSHGWPLASSSAPIPASNATEMDSKSSDEEFDEVFHLFEGSDYLSPKAVSVDTLSTPEKPTVLNPEPLAPTFSQFKAASEPDNSASPRYLPLETAHSNGVDIGQVNKNLDVPEDEDVELEVSEHQKSAVHAFVAQESSVADLYTPKTDLVLSNDQTQVKQESLAQEDIDTPPIPSVTSNGLLSTRIHHLDDKDHASDEGVDLEGPEDPKFSPDIMDVSSQKSPFETPALADAYLSDDSSEMGPENLCVPQVPEVRAISVPTAETADYRGATETNELQPDAFHSYPNRDIASPIAAIDDSHDLVSPPVDSSKLMVERDQNILNSSVSEEDPLESRPPVILLPPMNETSEEEQTEAIFLLSLGSKENSHHNEDSSTDHELQGNQTQEKPEGRGEITKDLDSDSLLAGDIIFEPVEKFQDISSKSREGETEVPEHENIEILPGAMFPVEEGPQEIQSQDDERIKTPARQVESYGKTVDVLEVGRQSPETFQDDNDTPDLVPTEHALPTGDHDESHELVSVPCSPVFAQADEVLNDKIDSKSKVGSTASQNESDEGTDTLIAASGATVTDTTSPSEILGKGEAIHSTPEATPPALSAEKLSNLSLTEADEFDDELGSEVTVDEERWRTVSDFGEQSSTTEHGWEEPLVTTDSSGLKSSTTNLFRQESMVTHAGNLVEADDANDLEIDINSSEEASRTISTPVSTPNGSIDYHEPDFQEIHFPLGKSISVDDQVSRSEDALETEKFLVASSDASVDASEDHAIKDVEIVPEHFSSKDLPFERFVTSNQQVSNAAISDVDEVDSELTRSKEEENLNEPIPLLKDEDLVVESPKKSLILSNQDTAKSIDVEEREGTSAPQLTLPLEMNTADTFTPENILWSSPEQHSNEETMLEDEETVVYNPKNSFVASGTPDTTILADIDGGTHSHVSRTASKDEESFNGNLEEGSLVNDEFVHSPKDRIDFTAQDLNTTSSGSHGIQTVSWKNENEVSSLVENSLHEDEDTAVASPKNFSVNSAEDTAISDVDELEEKLWKGGKEEEKSLNGSLERGEETMVESSKDQVVSSPMSQSSSPAEETPEISTSDVDYIQNHSNSLWSAESLNGSLERGEETVVESSKDQIVSSSMSQSNIPAERTPEISTSDVDYIHNHSNNLWSAESFNGSLKGEPLLEDEDTVVYRPTGGEFIMEESSPKGVENVVDSHMEVLKAPEDTVANGHTAEESLMEGSTYEGEVVDSPTETSNVPKDAVVCRPSIGDSTPELVEESSKEGVEPVVDSPTETSDVPKDAVVCRPSVGDSTPELVEESSKEGVEPVVDSPTESSDVPKDAVVCRPSIGDSTPELVEESSKEGVELVVDSPTETSDVPKDAVICSPSTGDSTLELVEESSKEGVEPVVDSPTETSDVLKDAVVCRPSIGDSMPELVEESSIEGVEPVVASPTEASDVPKDAVICSPSTGDSTPELMEESSIKGVEPVVDMHMEVFNVPDYDATNAALLVVEEQAAQRDDTKRESFNGNLERESKIEVEKNSEESVAAPDLLNGNYTSNLVETEESEKLTDKEGALDQRLEEKSSSEVEQPVVERFEESSVSPDQQNATNTSNAAVAELEKQTDKEEETLDQILDSDSPLEVEETAVESSEKELFVAPELVKAKDTSNLAAAEKLEEHSDKEEETVDKFLDTQSTFEVEQPVVESSEKELFVAPDVIDAKPTSHLYFVEELDKQTDKEEETLGRSLEAKSMNEAEEKMMESPEKESFVAPGLLDANYSSNFVVTDQLEKQTDKEEETLDQSPEVKSTVEAEQTMKDSSIQTVDARDLVNAKSSSVVVADEVEKQADEEENFEEKSTLEVADMVEKSSKESLIVSDAAAETLDAEDLDKHPTQAPSKEGESLNAINLEEESIQDTVVDSPSDNVKKELEYLSEDDDATQSPSGPTNLGANLVASSLNLTDEGAKAPHSSPIAEAVNSDRVNNSLDVSEVVQKDTVAKDSEEFSKAPAAEEESRMTNGEIFSNAPAAQEESRMTNGEIFSKAPAAEEESRRTNGEIFSKAPAAEEESRRTNGEIFSKAPAAEEESRRTNGEIFSKAPAAEEESRRTNGEIFSKAPAAKEESLMTNGEELKDSNAPVHETADKDGITVQTNPQADTTPESAEPQSPTATLYPLSKPPFSGSLQDRLWEEQAEAYNSGQGTPSRNGDHATEASGVSSSPKENPTSSEDQIQPVAAVSSNGNHAVVVGTSNGAASHENGSTPVQDQPKGNGKEKLHTPLRSLLLEESSHAGSLTPNGVNSSPSFIRRLFRVMSTSRSVEKEANQGKLKRSSSMWVSCLGSPQVQQ